MTRSFCLVVALAWVSAALAQDPTIYTHPSFETAGVIVSLPPGPNTGASATLEIRGPSDPGFREAHPFVQYDANNLAASLFGLEPDTTYDLRITVTTQSGTRELSSQVTTRPEFSLPSLSNTVTVSNDAELQSTLASVGAEGLEIRLAPGTYGPISITEWVGTAQGPLILRADDPAAMPVIDGTGATNAIHLDNTAHVYFDHLEVRNGVEKGIYVRSSHHTLIQNCDIHDNADYGILISKLEFAFWGDLSVGYHLIQDNTVSDQRHGVQLDNNPGAGTVIRRNWITGGRDNVKLCGDETAGRELPENAAHVLALTGLDQLWTNHDSELYDNVLSMASDDNLEVEGICVNARIYRNHLSNAINPVGIAPLIPGPAFFLRNVITGDWGEAGVKMNTNGNATNPLRNAFFYHNTFARVNTGPAINLWYAKPGSHNVPVKNVVFRNNVFWLQAGGRMLNANNEGSEHPDFDYNLWYTDTAASNLFEWWDGSVRVDYDSLAAFQAGTGQSPSGLFQFPELDGSLQPLTGSPVIDRGVRIPGINDDLIGPAPDIGAFEAPSDCIPVPPTGSVANVVLAVKSGGTDVVLSWDGATVAPPNFVLFKTDDKAQLDENESGIGDEVRLGATTATLFTDVNAVAASEPFYKVLPADNCNDAVFQ